MTTNRRPQDYLIVQAPAQAIDILAMTVSLKQSVGLFEIPHAAWFGPGLFSVLSGLAVDHTEYLLHVRSDDNTRLHAIVSALLKLAPTMISIDARVGYRALSAVRDTVSDNTHTRLLADLRLSLDIDPTYELLGVKHQGPEYIRDLFVDLCMTVARTGYDGVIVPAMSIKALRDCLCDTLLLIAHGVPATETAVRDIIAAGAHAVLLDLDTHPDPANQRQLLERLADAVAQGLTDRSSRVEEATLV